MNLNITSIWLLCKKDDKNFYENYTFNIINLDEVDKILSDYVTTHDKKFYIFLFRCEFVLEFDNNFTTNIQTVCCCNMDVITKIKTCLLCWIDCFKSWGYKNYNINQIRNKSNSDRCHMSYEFILNNFCKCLKDD